MIFWIFFLIFLTGYRCEKGCIGFYAPCCAGEVWDVTTKKCIACPIGYHGLNCSERCEYPFYGKDCTEGTCLHVCEKELCDIATGCKQTTAGPLSAATAVELYPTSTTTWASSTLVTKEMKADIDKGTDFLNQPIILIILSVNFVFFVIISIYVCNRVKKACSTTSSAMRQEIKNPDVKLDPYQALQIDTYDEIPCDYNKLNEVSNLVEKPSVVRVDSPIVSNKGDRTDYDDIANVIECK